MRPASHFDDIGERLRAVIVRKCGERQVSAVARRAGMSPAQLEQVLTGRRVPRLDTLSRVLTGIPARPCDLFCNHGTSLGSGAERG